ncbi:hypothetical protein Patl1_32096 [Pistacia atlantica]|uniref:Uncharacterized protein n=1 Tax=Pistacia atlantica TaxID=434234 RepID=A0ACC1ARB4_9ROSI|nr:hypothetical protein Patl1_32096 [Pistacia atlantica]
MWQNIEKTVNEATNKTERTKNPLPLEALSHYISAEFHSSKESQVKRTINILWLCLLFILALIIRHQGDCQVINTFEGFNVFVVCIMLSTAGGYSVLLIRNQPELAVLRRCCFMLSVVSMASALSILGYALFLEVSGLYDYELHFLVGLVLGFGENLHSLKRLYISDLW